MYVETSLYLWRQQEGGLSFKAQVLNYLPPLQYAVTHPTAPLPMLLLCPPGLLEAHQVDQSQT